MGSFWKTWRLGLKELRSLSHDPVLLGLVAASFTLMVYTAAKATRHEALSKSSASASTA